VGGRDQAQIGHGEGAVVIRLRHVSELDHDPPSHAWNGRCRGCIPPAPVWIGIKEDVHTCAPVMTVSLDTVFGRKDGMTEGEAPRAASPTLATGAVGIFYDRAVLGAALADLRARDYRVVAFDCRRWVNALAAGQELGAALGMPESLPRTIPVVGTYLEELARSDAPFGDLRLRLAVVLGVFDDFVTRHRADALVLLDEFAQAARMGQLFQHRILVLVQSDDPDLEVVAVPTVTIPDRQTFRTSLWTRARP